MNRTIKLLMIADVFTVTGFGLVDPILGIYIKENLVGGTIFAAGFASMLFLVTKCLVQLPFSRYVDRHDHKVRWLWRGSALVAMVPFLYLIATDVKVFYAASIIMGIGSGLVYPTWLGLFSTHLDRKHESFEWSLYSTMTGLGTAASAAIGAGIAQFFGFQLTFVFVSLLSLFGVGILFTLEKKKESSRKIPLDHYHRKRKGADGYSRNM